MLKDVSLKILFKHMKNSGPSAREAAASAVADKALQLYKEESQKGGKEGWATERGMAGLAHGVFHRA